MHQGFSLFSLSLREQQQQLEKILFLKKTSIDYRRTSHNCCVQIIMKKKKPLIFCLSSRHFPFFSGATSINLINIIFLSYYFLSILCAKNYIGIIMQCMYELSWRPYREEKKNGGIDLVYYIWRIVRTLHALFPARSPSRKMFQDSVRAAAGLPCLTDATGLRINRCRACGPQTTTTTTY